MQLLVDSRNIWVTFQKEGIHLFPAAIDDPALATGGDDDVSFLGYAHRHIFHFRVEISVVHNDRDIEFIQFKRWMERLYAQDLVLDHKSCEMIADELQRKSLLSTQAVQLKSALLKITRTVLR